MLRKTLYKVWLKTTNKEKYKSLKISEDIKRRVFLYETQIKDKIENIHKALQGNSAINFLHSGHLGDIIYSLPLIKELLDRMKILHGILRLIIVVV